MAGKSTPLSKALTLWEEKEKEKNNGQGKLASEAEEIKLIFLVFTLVFRFRPSINSKHLSSVPSLEYKNSPFPPIASIKWSTFRPSSTSPGFRSPVITSRKSPGLSKLQALSNNFGSVTTA